MAYCDYGLLRAVQALVSLLENITFADIDNFLFNPLFVHHSHQI